MRPPVSWSIELSTTGLLKANSLAARVLPRLPAGVRIYLPALPQDPPDAIENALTLLRRENPGLVPVPHIAASRGDVGLVKVLAEHEKFPVATKTTDTKGRMPLAVVVGDARKAAIADIVGPVAEAVPGNKIAPEP